MRVRDLYYQNLGIDQRIADEIGGELSTIERYLSNSINHLDIRNYGLEFDVLERFHYLITRLPVVVVPTGQIIALEIGAKEYDDRVPLLGQGNQIIEHELLAKQRDRTILRLVDNHPIQPSKKLFYGMNEVKWELLRFPDFSGLKELKTDEGRPIRVLRVDKNAKGTSIVLDSEEVPNQLFHSGKELFFQKESPKARERGPLMDDLGLLELVSEKKRGDGAEITTSREIKGHLRDNVDNHYRWEPKGRPGENGHLVSLREPKGDDQDDAVSDSSKIDVFFSMLGDEDRSDIIEIQERNGKEVRSTIRVMAIDREERKITLDRLPSPTTTMLYPRDNSSQLRKQRDAVRVLRDHPSNDHRPLLRLFETWDKVKWSSIDRDRKEVRWQFLTDGSRDGTGEQRSFVSAALDTPDFVLLEGPPGSGKTTAISELVYQILTADENKGKKVLLCAPTHVAVDNVITKLKERFGSVQALMDRGIVPLRLGREEGRVDEDLRSLHINRRMETISALFKGEAWFDELPSRGSGEGGDNRYHRRGGQLDQEKVLEDAVVNSSNLICGTTIGVLGFPIFEERGRGFCHAYFDYMIIDEASKTTLPEFLVPAVRSKKWIIVGDVRQLAPSVDILGLRVNLDCKMEDRLRQRAHLLFLKLFFNQEAVYRDGRKKLPPKFIYLADDEEILTIVREIGGKIGEDLVRRKKREQEGRANHLVPIDQFSKDLMIISDVHNSTIGGIFSILRPDDLEENFVRVLSTYLVIVDRKLYPQIVDRLPGSHILLDPDRPFDRHPIQDRAFRAWSSFLRSEGRALSFHLEKGGDTDKLEEVLENLTISLGRTWGSELAWRLKRVYELSSSQGLHDLLEETGGKYRASIRALMPSGGRLYQEILNNARISLPSVITCLQKGVFGSDGNEGWKTVFSHGFPDDALEGRYHVLTYQHRMHPDISRVARDIFYRTDDGLQRLKDSRSVQSGPGKGGERDWPPGLEPLYDSRFVWRDVPNGADRRNINVQEVDEVMKDLDAIVRWLKENEYLGKKANGWSIMIISFYEAQRRAVRDRLRRYTGMPMSEARFQKDGVKVFNYTVDMNQGREADFVLMTLSRTHSIGFMDCPNRINVGITRARYQQVIFGKADFYGGRRSCPEWRSIVERSVLL